MEKSDTIKLLQECDAGSEMAVTSIDELMQKVTDSELAELLEESQKHHEKLEYAAGEWNGTKGFYLSGIIYA